VQGTWGAHRGVKQAAGSGAVADDGGFPGAELPEGEGVLWSDAASRQSQLPPDFRCDALPGFGQPCLLQPDPSRLLGTKIPPSALFPSTSMLSCTLHRRLLRVQNLPFSR